MMEEFQGRRWTAAQPKHLDFVNAEILLIGERSGVRQSGEQTDKAALEQLEELQLEDEERIKHVEGE